MVISRWLEVLNVPILFFKSQVKSLAMSQAGPAGLVVEFRGGAPGINRRRPVQLAVVLNPRRERKQNPQLRGY
jgi:hypothetical protein